MSCIRPSWRRADEARVEATGSPAPASPPAQGDSHLRRQGSAPEEHLLFVLRRCRSLYNSALEQRKAFYQMRRKSLGYSAQAAELAEIKAAYLEYQDIYSQVLQDMLRRLDKAFAYDILSARLSTVPETHSMPEMRGDPRPIWSRETRLPRSRETGRAGGVKAEGTRQKTSKGYRNHDRAGGDAHFAPGNAGWRPTVFQESFASPVSGTEHQVRSDMLHAQSPHEVCIVNFVASFLSSLCGEV